MTAPAKDARKVATYCYQCVAGPDLLTVSVEDGVATKVEPNFAAAKVHPGGGKICVKAYGLVQKTYNPNRVLTPMRRTNPKKGREQDPGFEAISWDEALDEIASRVRAVLDEGPLDETGYPRIAASFGGGGTPGAYMGTFPSFLATIGPVDFGIGGGQGVKCYHSEHLYGELWHRAFTVGPDTPMTRYMLSFGSNVEASGGVAGVWRHADARARGMRRVQIEPHLSVTAACSAQWIPIRPKTDPAFMFALIHVLLHEHPLEALDVPFLKHRTASPYLVGPNGYFIRDPADEKPLAWDEAAGAAVGFDEARDPALLGVFSVAGVEIGPDGERWTHDGAVDCRPAHQALVDHMASYTPEWAAGPCDVPADTMRSVANEYLQAACIGETVEIEGRTLPFRPVAVTLGKTVNNGWGGYECCWARTVLSCLVGALEVPGGTLGTTVRLNRPADDRIKSVVPGPDGFMAYPMNPTDKEGWVGRPTIRNAHEMLVPLAANGPWSPALGPTHLGWLFQDSPPKGIPIATPPEVWFVYRTNPAISNWDAPGVAEKISRFPYTVAFAYTLDETNYMADILLPECTDLESTQLIRIGGTKYVEQFWHYQGFALRQAAVEGRGETRDFTDIATELASRVGRLAEYNATLNRGGAGVKLAGEGYDFSLDPDAEHTVDEIWDAVCRAASAELTEGRESDGLEWYRENGYKLGPFPHTEWYLYTAMEDQGLRFELPYQERLTRVGRELANRLHERGLHWWDKQLAEYQPLPAWKDFPGLWETAVISAGGTPEDYPFWLLTARSMQYAWGGNVAIPMIHEVADNIKGHAGVIMNARAAERLGIAEGDLVEVRSTLRATKGRVVLRQGIRPDTLLMIGQFDHWVTPFAKDLQVPSMNTVTPITMDLTDATGSSADIVRVAVARVGAAA